MKKLVLSASFSNKLDRLQDPVAELHYTGEDIANLKDAPIIAIVGTRKPTPYGKQVSEQLAGELAGAGVVIVSGLALGIDALAHKACIIAGGRAIAVLPSGLKNIYPATNRPLADDIIRNGGTLISEYPETHKPQKVEFLERNRIIAGLSDLVIIPEAARGSGSLNTAKHAQQANIPVAVVPGNITSPMSEGTNQLLKSGALAITNAEDILQLLGIDKKPQQKTLNLNEQTTTERVVLDAIRQGNADVQSLQDHTKLSTVDLQTTLTMLEIQGQIKQNDLGAWQLR